MKKIQLCCILSVFACCVLSAVAILVLINPEAASAQKKTESQEESFEVKMPVSKPEMVENYLNTVTSTDSDGIKYKLIIYGDQLPVLYVNGRVIRTEESASYNDIIEKLSFILLERQKCKKNNIQ